MLPIYKRLSKLDFEKTQTDFDATSLYPSAMMDKKSVHPNIETGFAFIPDRKDVYSEAFNNKSFNQDGNESGILKLKFYNPPNLIFNIYQLKKNLIIKKLIE